MAGRRVIRGVVGPAVWLALVLAPVAGAMAAPSADQLWDTFYRIKKQQPRRALAILDQLAELRPNSVEVWKSTGYTNLLIDRKAKALQAFQKASRLGPDDAEIWKNIGYLQLDFKHKQKALTAFSRASALTPNDAEIWTNIGYLQTDLGHKPSALKAFVRASRLVPNSTEIWKNIGYLNIDLGHKRKALHAFRQAATTEKHDVAIWKNIAYLESDLGQKKRALADMRRAADLAPSDTSLLLEIAYLESGQGQTHRAGRDFMQVYNQSESADERRQACSGAHNAKAERTRLLNDPYFGDVYFAPYVMRTRVHDTVFPFKLRLGRHVGEAERVNVYGFVEAQTDTHSSGGAQPRILNDNAVIAGFGFDYQPLASLPVRFYAEAGYGYDLIDRPRSPGRFGVSTGLTGYKSWGLPGAYCGQSTHLTWQPYATVYGSLEYDTRQDHNLLGQLQSRAGATVARGPWGSLRAYWEVNVLTGAKARFYNNLVETGPGVAWKWPTAIPVTLRASYLEGRYLSNPNDSPRGATYHGGLLQLEAYWAF